MAEKKTAKKAVKMTVESSSTFSGATVRNDDGVKIGWIKDGTKVDVLEEIKGERVEVKGKGADGKTITGTVLASCLKD